MSAISFAESIIAESIIAESIIAELIIVMKPKKWYFKLEFNHCGGN